MKKTVCIRQTVFCFHLNQDSFNFGVNLAAMKRIIIVSAIIVFTFVSLTGQQPVFVKGSRVFNAGLGVGTPVFSSTYNRMVIPPLSASVEIGVTDHVLEKGSVGVGPYLAFLSYKWQFSNYRAQYTNTVIGVRGNFHYPLLDKLDTYSGLLLGYDIVNVKETGDPYESYEDSASHIAWAWFVGGRYYFRENMAAMAEIGYGVAYLNLGMAFSF
jgi:hypothetical protein